MASYSDKQMLRDVNGDLIPQYWDIQDEEFKPLTGQNGAQDTRLTASNVEELKSYVDDDTYTSSGATWRYISNKIKIGPTVLYPIDYSCYSKRSIYIENNMNHTIRSIEVYGTSESSEDKKVSREDTMIFSFEVDDLESGESVYITEEGFPELKKPCIGLAIRTGRETGFDYEDAKG